jgi:ribonucleotide reductase alpha subunit
MPTRSRFVTWLRWPCRATLPMALFDHQKLYEVTYQAAINLNKIIDGNYYPVAEAEYIKPKRHRPIGLGVQGLADAFILPAPAV